MRGRRVSHNDSADDGYGVEPRRRSSQQSGRIAFPYDSFKLEYFKLETHKHESWRAIRTGHDVPKLSTGTLLESYVDIDRAV